MSKIINNLQELLTEENLQNIKNHEFSIEEYKTILKNIDRHGRKNLNLDKNMTALEQITEITVQHTIIYESKDNLNSGYYVYNKLYLNRNLPKSQQIATLIHELSHHIYAEIFEGWLLTLFKVKKKSIIESFVMFMLNNSIENRAANEYISYIVEGRFTPKKYQNYISFIQLIMELNINVKESKEYFIFGHEVSHDIDNLLKPVIDENLRKLIEEQFEEDDITPSNQELKFDYRDERFSEEEKIDIMKEMIYFIFDYFVNGSGEIEELEGYMINLEK